MDKTTSKPLSKVEITRRLVDEISKILVRQLVLGSKTDGGIPETGSFVRWNVWFNVIHTDNKGALYIEPAKDTNKRDLILSLHRDGSDKVVSNYCLLNASNAELKAYLEDDENLDALVESILRLSDRVDELM